ncbi:FkbM family methyltransferase [Streptomyces sp. RB6PN25]|uniref:FkbM family methyltransferase n=1 Tax=Streptomyces humicola TaxID=2953240 RepID=A0ABT1Q5T2_9ACTN|nr:FkbM family methyltransferase [Streptomyces humicola]MCQ4084743.1 FkbM family methyltransferase [Streptomyces humicola]
MTLAAALGPRLPNRLLALAVDALYPRQEPELGRVEEICPPYGTALDIGAWYGPWSRRLARRADRVVALEPVPEVCRALRDTVPPGVEVINAAASDRLGDAPIWLADRRGREARGLTSLEPRPYVHRGTRPVRLTTVDALDLPDVSFVKIDVEGHEAAVLRGAEKTLRRDRPNLFIEAETRIQPVERIIGLLREWGFRGWVLPGSDWVPLESFDLTGHQQQAAHVIERGLLRRSLRPHPRYVNSVLFTPEGSTPFG